MGPRDPGIRILALEVPSQFQPTGHMPRGSLPTLPWSWYLVYTCVLSTSLSWWLLLLASCFALILLCFQDVDLPLRPLQLEACSLAYCWSLLLLSASFSLVLHMVARGMARCKFIRHLLKISQ